MFESQIFDTDKYIVTENGEEINKDMMTLNKMDQGMIECDKMLISMVNLLKKKVNYHLYLVVVVITIVLLIYYKDYRIKQVDKQVVLHHY